MASWDAICCEISTSSGGGGAIDTGSLPVRTAQAAAAETMSRISGRRVLPELREMALVINAETRWA